MANEVVTLTSKLAVLEWQVKESIDDIDELKALYKSLDDRMDAFERKQDVTNEMLGCLVEKKRSSIVEFVEKNAKIIMVLILVWVALSGAPGAIQVLKLALE